MVCERHTHLKVFIIMRSLRILMISRLMAMIHDSATISVYASTEAFALSISRNILFCMTVVLSVSLATGIPPLLFPLYPLPLRP